MSAVKVNIEPPGIIKVNGVPATNVFIKGVLFTDTGGGGGGTWGSITGTLSAQTDLQTALNGKQPIDGDLTAIAAISPSNDDIIQRKAGAWTNRTPTQVKTDLILVKGDVGLGNVDNTADTAKPVSTAQQTALNAKANTSHTHAASDVSAAAFGSGDFSFPGRLGIGAAPTFDFDLYKSAGSGLWARFININASSYTGINIGASAGDNRFSIYAFGASYSSAAQYQAGKVLLEALTNLYLTATDFRFHTGSIVVGGGTSAPAASAQVDLVSTTKGFLPPRMTKTQRDAIASPATGLMIYQTDNTPGLRVYNGTNWMRFTETAD